jgi:putative ABC transport system permease protein
MPLLSRLISFSRRLRRREQTEKDLDDELRFHLDSLAEQKINEGMNPEEARRAAKIELGGLDQVKEQVRAARTGAWLESLLQDIRFGLRMLRKNPGFSAVAILTLALGIGANTAIFSLVNAVLLRPLPFKNPTRLVWMAGRWPSGDNGALAPGDFLDYRAENQVFEHLAAMVHGNTIFNLAGNGGAQQVRGSVVTYDFLQTLGIRPLLGRLFIPSDEAVSDPRVVVLSHRLWEERFGGSPDAIGKSIDLDGNGPTVVGVVPDLPLFSDRDLWIPAPFNNPDMRTRHSHFLHPIGLLKPGVSLAQADADLNVITARIEHDHADFSNYGWSYYVEPLQTALVGNVGRSLMILLGVVGLVLLIACANVASLLLAKNAARRREIAIRMALGAVRIRLLRQVLTESMLLAFAGGAAGICLAYCSIDLLRKFEPANLPRLGEASMSGAVLGFTAALSIITGILFGLGPALRASRKDLTLDLKSRGSAGASKSKNRMHNALVVAQFVLSFVVLIASGLLLRSFWRVVHVRPGFDPSHVVTADISITGTANKNPVHRVAFLQQVQDRIKTIPGVDSAGFISELPLSGQTNDTWFTVQEHPPANANDRSVADSRSVSESYFQTMHIPLLAGREFTRADKADAPRVVVINEPLARIYFPGENPIGKHLKIFEGQADFVPSTIIGIVGGNKEAALQDSLQPAIFIPYTEAPGLRMDVVVRSSRDPLVLVPAIRSAIRAVDSGIATSAFRSLGEIVSSSEADQRFDVILVTTFAAIALLLAAVGVFGVQSYLVTEQTREIGIRLALGAPPRSVLALVLRKGILLSALGAAIGFVAALGITRLMASMLYQVSGTDPLTFAAVIAIEIGVALLACWIPARRAMRVDPMVALRHE